MLSIDLYLRRRSAFYSLNFILPSFMISILSISGFILPPESGEKIGLLKLTFFIDIYIYNIIIIILIVIFLNSVSGSIFDRDRMIDKVDQIDGSDRDPFIRSVDQKN